MNNNNYANNDYNNEVTFKSKNFKIFIFYIKTLNLIIIESVAMNKTIENQIINTGIPFFKRYKNYVHSRISQEDCVKNKNTVYKKVIYAIKA